MTTGGLFGFDNCKNFRKNSSNTWKKTGKKEQKFGVELEKIFYTLIASNPVIWGFQSLLAIF
jgi:hypothetical protein